MEGWKHSPRVEPVRQDCVYPVGELSTEGQDGRERWIKYMVWGRVQWGAEGKRLSMAGTINQIVYLANIHIYEALAMSQAHFNFHGVPER